MEKIRSEASVLCNASTPPASMRASPNLRTFTLGGHSDDETSLKGQMRYTVRRGMSPAKPVYLTQKIAALVMV